MSEPSETEHNGHGPATPGEKNPGDMLFGWTASPKAGNLVFIVLAVLCALLFLADFGVHRHEYLEIAKFPAFYALWGFGAFSFVVFMGWPLRKLLWRPENYYEPEDQAND